MKRHLVRWILVIFLIAQMGVAQTSSAAGPVMVDVWSEEKMPGHGAGESERDMPSKGDNVRRITNISRPMLTLFSTTNKKGPAPAVIVCPGGGYGYVVYDKEGTAAAAWLNAAGVHALVLKYRVPNNREGALQDLQRSLSLLRTRAEEWGVDPKRIGVLGFSAGGNLAAKASTLFERRAYSAIDAVDQQSCRPDFAILIYPAYLDNKNGHVSPDLDLRAKIPPTLIIHSEDDKSFVAGSKVYHAALEEAKVAHDFKLYATGGHGYGLRTTKEAQAWPEDAREWLRKIQILP
jgi:acetyl esterase/lipase